MRLGGEDFDFRQGADQRPRPLREHRLHIGRPSDDLALAPARLLEQNLEAPSDRRPVEGLPPIFDEFLERREASDLRRFINLAGHIGGGRSRPGGLFEGVGRGEAHRADEREGLIEVGVGFAWVADDEVR